MIQDFIWSPEVAYAVGLLVTDGNLSNDGRHIVLRSSDLEQIENFKKCLKLSNKIGIPKISGEYAKRICYRLQFGDVHFYQWLLEIGLFPAKTYTIGALQIPDEYFRDFLRGHLDGDGTITSYQDCYNQSKHSDYIYTRLFVRFIFASPDHIQWIRKAIIRLIGVRGDLFEIISRGREDKASIWQLKFMKKESMKLLPWIYYSKNLVCLKRKRLKAERTLLEISTMKRKTYTRNVA